MQCAGRGRTRHGCVSGVAPFHHGAVCRRGGVLHGVVGEPGAPVAVQQARGSVRGSMEQGAVGGETGVLLLPALSSRTCSGPCTFWYAMYTNMGVSSPCKASCVVMIRKRSRVYRKVA